MDGEDILCCGGSKLLSLSQLMHKGCNVSFDQEYQSTDEGLHLL